MRSNANVCRILVVDDEPIVCESIRMLLSFDGHDVRTAGNGPEALSRFDPEAFDLLITDFAMSGMDGAELARRVREQAPQLPVILLTAYAEMLDSWKADLTSVDRVMSKPFRLEDLRTALAQITGRRVYPRVDGDGRDHD